MREGKYMDIRNNRGFSLLELTCAIFVVTVAGFGSIQLYSVGMDKIIMMREYDVATSELRNEVERLRSLPFDAVSDGMAVSPPSAALATLSEPLLTVAATERSPGLKAVDVSLTWNSRGGRTIMRKLTTLIADHGVEGKP